MDFALRQLQTCHLSRNCADWHPRGRVQVQATAAANPPLTLTQRALLQTAVRRKVTQQGSSQDGQQVPSLELSTKLFRVHQLADSSPEEFDQLMAEHERQLRLRQQHQQHQQQQLQQAQQPRERRARLPPSQRPQQQQHQQQPQQQLPGGSSSAAPADQLAQMRLLQQQLALRQVLLQQQQRKRQLLLQIRREPAVLTTLIKRSTSWVRLQDLFSTFMPLFNPIHVSAAITHLAQLQEQPMTPQQLAVAPQGLQDLVQELTRAVVACIPDFGPRQISNSLWAISKLGADGLLTRKLRNAMLTAFVDKMPYAAPQHVAVMAAAVAKMGWPHCAEWAQQLVQAAEVRMAYFRPQELAILLHALARLDAPLPAAWRSSFLAACLPNMHSLTLQELSMLAVSLVRLQHKPDQQWLGAFMHAAQVQLSHAAAAGAGGAAGGWLQTAPGVHHMQLQQQQLHHALAHSAVAAGANSSTSEASTAAAAGAVSQPSWEGQGHSSQGEGEPAEVAVDAAFTQHHHSANFTGVQGVVNIVWALANWQAVPPGAWQACCFAAIQAHIRELTVQGVSTLVWSFAKLQLQPPRALLLQLMQHTRRRTLLPAATATDMAMLTWGLGSLGLTAAALEAATAAHAGSTDSTWEGSTAQHSMPRSRSRVSRSAGFVQGWSYHWLNDLMYHSFRVLPAASTADLATLLVGAVKMRLDPGSQWLGLALVEASHRLPTMTPQQLTSTLLSLARLRCQPSDSFLQAFCTRSEQLLAATAAAGGKARAACRRSTQYDQQGANPPPQQLRERSASGAAIAAAAQAGPQFYTPQCLANTLGALAMLGYCPSRQWRASFFSASAALLPCFTGRDFAYTIWALALLETPPPSAWMDAYLVHLRQHVPTMTSQQLSAVIWALARLNHRPGVDWMNRFLDRVAVLTPQGSEAGSSSGDGGSSGASDSSSGSSGTLGGMPAPPSPLQLSGYFSGIILQGLTGWACSCLDLGFNGSSGSSEGHTSSSSSEGHSSSSREGHTSSSSSEGHSSSSREGHTSSSSGHASSSSSSTGHTSGSSSSCHDSSSSQSQSSSSSGGAEEQHGPSGKRRVVRRVRYKAVPAAVGVGEGPLSVGAVGSSEAAGGGSEAAAEVTHSRTVANDGSITFRF